MKQFRGSSFYGQFMLDGKYIGIYVKRKNQYSGLCTTGKRAVDGRMYQLAADVCVCSSTYISGAGWWCTKFPIIRSAKSGSVISK